jgi:hypothetical protein
VESGVGSGGGPDEAGVRTPSVSMVGAIGLLGSDGAGAIEGVGRSSGGRSNVDSLAAGVPSDGVLLEDGILVLEVGAPRDVPPIGAEPKELLLLDVDGLDELPMPDDDGARDELLGGVEEKNWLLGDAVEEVELKELLLLGADRLDELPIEVPMLDGAGVKDELPVEVEVENPPPAG